MTGARPIDFEKDVQLLMGPRSRVNVPGPGLVGPRWPPGSGLVPAGMTALTCASSRTGWFAASDPVRSCGFGVTDTGLHRAAVATTSAVVIFRLDEARAERAIVEDRAPRSDATQGPDPVRRTGLLIAPWSGPLTTVDQEARGTPSCSARRRHADLRCERLWTAISSPSRVR